MKRSNLIHIGTSGWHYQHWRETFYPEKLAPEDWLDYYAQHFHTVEINNSFYQLPEEKTLKQWRDTVPDGFSFTVKANRYITHQKKLKDPQQSLSNLLERIAVLGDKLGPILFQLPPRWHCNAERLGECLDTLPGDYRYVFEFRDRSWFVPEVYEQLTTHQAAFCIYDFAGELSPKEVTADFIYVRLHGPDEAYQGQYSTQTLSGWAGAFSTWTSQGKEVYCYFNNDQFGYAARDARHLQSMIDAA